MGRSDPPRLIYAELRTKGKYMTKDQKKWKAILEANGAEFHLWRPENLNEIIEELA